MSTRRKLPIEIRRMRSLGKYSSAMSHNATIASRTWLDLGESDSAAAPVLLCQLIATCREAVRQFETAREGAAEMGCLLAPDPAWHPPPEE